MANCALFDATCLVDKNTIPDTNIMRFAINLSWFSSGQKYNIPKQYESNQHATKAFDITVPKNPRSPFSFLHSEFSVHGSFIFIERNVANHGE